MDEYKGKVMGEWREIRGRLKRLGGRSGAMVRVGERGIRERRGRRVRERESVGELTNGG